MSAFKTESIARALRALRAWRGISQSALAEKSGYSASTICAWEAGRKRPGLRARRDVSEALFFSHLVLENLASCPGDALQRAALNLFDSRQEDSIVGRNELADIVGVAPTTIHNWTKAGTLNPKKDGRYRWYSRTDLNVATHLAKLRCRRRAR